MRSGRSELSRLLRELGLASGASKYNAERHPQGNDQLAASGSEPGRSRCAQLVDPNGPVRRSVGAPRAGVRHGLGHVGWFGRPLENSSRFFSLAAPDRALRWIEIPRVDGLFPSGHHFDAPLPARCALGDLT
jgi:hypothetical protein